MKKAHHFGFSRLLTLRRRHGFTLMETLLVAGLIAMTGLALYQTVDNGIRLWERSQDVLLSEDAMLFLDRLTQDLHNTLDYAFLPFDGKSSRVQIPTVIETPPDPVSHMKTEMNVSQPGTVEYRFDEGTRSIVRSQINYGRSVKHLSGEARALLSDVVSLKFTYLYNDGGGWQEKQSVGYIPAAVTVDLEFKSVNGIESMRRTIWIPVRA